MNRVWLPQVVASGMLLWALRIDNPYTYYILLRWVCFATFLYLAMTGHKAGNKNWTWLFGVLAAIYNPLLPANLSREVWSYVNLATVAAIVVSFVHGIAERSTHSR